MRSHKRTEIGRENNNNKNEEPLLRLLKRTFRLEEGEKQRKKEKKVALSLLLQAFPLFNNLSPVMKFKTANLEWVQAKKEWKV